MEYFDAADELCSVFTLLLRSAIFFFLVVRLLPLWGLFFGLLFSWRLRHLGVACFAVRLLACPFFSSLPALGDESGSKLRSIEKVDAERQMVADASVVERTEVGAEGLGERAAAEWFE